LDKELDGMKVEFISSGNRVYRNYHPGLTAQRCDSQGCFLPKGALPLPHGQKLPNDWTPYCSQSEFKVTEFLFTHTQKCWPKKLTHY
ncbi:hypothetical protein PISMIDRAFT_119480, partial [Pisolithus microcarpus 441]